MPLPTRPFSINILPLRSFHLSLSLSLLYLDCLVVLSARALRLTVAYDAQKSIWLVQLEQTTNQDECCRIHLFILFLFEVRLYDEMHNVCSLFDGHSYVRFTSLRWNLNFFLPSLLSIDRARHSARSLNKGTTNFYGQHSTNEQTRTDVGILCVFHLDSEMYEEKFQTIFRHK